MSPGAVPLAARISPKLYEEIMGKPCKHVFLRSGFCRWQSGGVGCGEYGEARRYEFRLAIIERLFLAYLRVNDKELARETYTVFGGLFPIRGSRNEWSGELPPHSYDAESRPSDPLSILYSGLSLVTTRDDWQQMLDAVKAPTAPSPPILVDRNTLVLRLSDSHAEVRLEAIDRLATLDDPESWLAIGNSLDDPSLRERAAERIIRARRFPLFGKMLRSLGMTDSPDSNTGLSYPAPLAHLHVSLSDQEIRSLMAIKDLDVDLLCFAAIRAKEDGGFLDDLLQVLNERPSSEAIFAVKDLLAGPSPLEIWHKLRGDPERPDPSQVIASVSLGPLSPTAALTAGGRRGYETLQDAKRLALGNDSSAWPELKNVYESWVKQGGNEICGAGIAQAMYALDPNRTISHFSHELDPRYEHLQRTSIALAAMGTIADARFLGCLESFRGASKGSLYEQPSHAKKLLDYAVHRCKGVHKSKLVKASHGTYVIQQ